MQRSVKTSLDPDDALRDAERKRVVRGLVVRAGFLPHWRRVNARASALLNHGYSNQQIVAILQRTFRRLPVTGGGDASARGR